MRAAATAAAMVIALASAPAASAASCGLEAGATRAVTRVVDGETLRLDDGSELRLAGIVAPRSPDSATDSALWPPAEQARAALDALAAGRSVEIAFSGPRTDRYGRLVAHVFLVDGRRRDWLQGKLLAAGHARVFASAEHWACHDELLSHERLAFAAGRGLWGNAAYQVRSADEGAALMRYRHTLQLVEGEVAGVTEVRGRVYVNFGPDWRTDFTASYERSRVTGWPAEPGALKGQRVRVRGFIERRNGPYVELTHPSQLEVLPAPAATQRRGRRARRDAGSEPAGGAEAAR